MSSQRFQSSDVTATPASVSSSRHGPIHPNTHTSTRNRSRGRPFANSVRCDIPSPPSSHPIPSATIGFTNAYVPTRAAVLFFKM